MAVTALLSEHLLYPGLVVMRGAWIRVVMLAQPTDLLNNFLGCRWSTDSGEDATTDFRVNIPIIEDRWKRRVSPASGARVFCPLNGLDPDPSAHQPPVLLSTKPPCIHWQVMRQAMDLLEGLCDTRWS